MGQVFSIENETVGVKWINSNGERRAKLAHLSEIVHHHRTSFFHSIFKLFYWKTFILSLSIALMIIVIYQEYKLIFEVCLVLEKSY